MASIILQSVSQEQFLQSGGYGTPPALKLRTDSSSDINLYSADYGTKPTLTKYNNTDLKLYPVIDDTPPKISPILPSNIIYLLQAGVLPVAPSSGSKMRYWDGLQWQNIDTIVVFQ